MLYVFMFTDVIFLNKPGVMITDFKMLLLPVLFISSDSTVKKELSTTNIDTGLWKTSELLFFLPSHHSPSLPPSTSSPYSYPEWLDIMWERKTGISSENALNVRQRSFLTSVCVYWNLVEPCSELCCSRNPLEYQRHMGKKHCKLKKHSGQGSWVNYSRWILKKHRVVILERR